MIIGWRIDGGEIEIQESELRPVLEEAYDENMPNWVALISYEDGAWHVA